MLMALRNLDGPQTAFETVWTETRDIDHQLQCPVNHYEAALLLVATLSDMRYVYSWVAPVAVQLLQDLILLADAVLASLEGQQTQRTPSYPFPHVPVGQTPHSRPLLCCNSLPAKTGCHWNVPKYDILLIVGAKLLAIMLAMHRTTRNVGMRERIRKLCEHLSYDSQEVEPHVIAVFMQLCMLYQKHRHWTCLQEYRHIVDGLLLDIQECDEPRTALFLLNIVELCTEQVCWRLLDRGEADVEEPWYDIPVIRRQTTRRLARPKFDSERSIFQDLQRGGIHGTIKVNKLELATRCIMAEMSLRGLQRSEWRAFALTYRTRVAADIAEQLTSMRARARWMRAVRVMKLAVLRPELFRAPPPH